MRPGASGKYGPATPDGRGRYYFELSIDDNQLGFELQAGLIPPEFMELTNKLHAQTITEPEQQRLRQIKEYLALTILAAPFTDLFKVQFPLGEKAGIRVRIQNGQDLFA